MRARAFVIGQLCAALVGVMFCATGARAQDLESELPIELRAEILPLEGSQPFLVACELTAAAGLDCRADRPLRKVECASESAPDAPLKTTVRGDSFTCQARGGANELRSGFKLYLLSEDSQFSEWIVRGSTPAQASRWYKAEMQAEAQAGGRAAPYHLGPYTRLFFGAVADRSLYAGIDARMSFTERFFGRIRYGHVLAQGPRQRFDTIQTMGGLHQPLFSDWSIELELGFHSMGDSGIKDLKSAELGSRLKWDLWPGVLSGSGELRLQWPEVQSLRQSAELVLRGEIGPVWRNWRIDTELSAMSRVWQDTRRSQNGFSVYGQLGVSWVN